MPRKLTLKTNELDDLPLYLIYQYGDNWEEEWKPLQGFPITSLLTVVSQDDMTHALKGWTKPLFKALNLAPEFALRKLPSFDCDKRRSAPTTTERTALRSQRRCHGALSRQVLKIWMLEG